VAVEVTEATRRATVPAGAAAAARAPCGKIRVQTQTASIARSIAGVVLALALAAASWSCAIRAKRSHEQAAIIRVMLPASERPFWRPIVDRFAQTHPRARVELVEGPESTDLREDLYTASLLARDPTFDLVYMDVTWTAKFAAAGWLRPLDQLFTSAECESLLPAALAAGRFSGRLYRIPARTDVGVLYYRRDLLEAARLPTPQTLDELFGTAKRLQSPPSRWGFVWQGKQYEGLVCNYLELLSGCGGFWVEPGTREVGLDRPEAKRALSFMVRCIAANGISPPGATTYQEEESRRLFQDGRAIFLRNWPYVWSLAQAEDSQVRGKIDVSPMVHEPGRRGWATLGGWGLGLSSYSRHPELAADLVRIVISLEGQRWLCSSTGFAPARSEAYRDPELLAANPFLTRIGALHKHALARPPIPRYDMASDILQRHLSAALTGGETVSAALAAATRETQHVLAARDSGR